MKKMEQWHRRQALTLASQLPDNTPDAQMVLQALKELVDTFLDGPETVAEGDALSANVVAFKGGQPGV